MRYEFDVYGVFVPAALIWTIVAYALSAIIRLAMIRLGLFRWVWHPNLFNLALFVCWLGVVAYVSREYLS